MSDFSNTQQAFAALADPTRLRLIELLANGDAARVSDLVERFAITRQSLTRHLDVLCQARLTQTRWQGRERFTELAPRAFEPIHDWLSRYDRFWKDHLDTLKSIIEEDHRQ